ncbi:MAG: amidohydrolase family protein [Acidimicrobiia bacterium]
MTQPTHDLVIRNGTVVDGTGGPLQGADVAVDGGRITAIGEVPGSGREEIDARDQLVAPGWVDVHTHYDGQVSWDSLIAPSSWQGVTTAVMGNCGVGFAPVAPDKHGWLIELMEGVEDIPGTALHEGITWEWESFPEYLDAVGHAQYALDIGAQVPHAALRGYVMGERGGDHAEVPTGDEIARMGALAAEGIRAGALGFSTSRTVNHKSKSGAYTPSLTATADELLGIASAVGATGLGVFEVVADLDDLDAEFALIRAMSEVSGRPTSLTVLQKPGARSEEYRRVLALIDQAVADGVPMHGQVPTRPVGLIMSIDSRINPFVASPTFGRLAALPLAERVARLRDPETRAVVVAEAEAAKASSPLTMFGAAFALGDVPRYDPDPADNLHVIAERTGRSVFDVALDELLAADGTGRLYLPVMNYADGTMSATREMLMSPNTVPGLGDAGAHCTLICDASMPTFMLSYWARDAAVADRLPIEFAVKRQTADTADLVGLADRGRLVPGARADVNVIDFDALAPGSPRMVDDLPAGGRRLVQRASGYRATVVAGSVVHRDGADTGARPGRLVRGAQPAPA